MMASRAWAYQDDQVYELKSQRGFSERRDFVNGPKRHPGVKNETPGHNP